VFESGSGYAGYEVILVILDALQGFAAVHPAPGMDRSGPTKNVLAAVMNASAVAIFIFSPEVRWLQVGVSSVGATGGGVIRALMLNQVSEKPLRLLVVLVGVGLTIGLFFRPH
jgi:uncharacterized protein